MNKYHHNDKFFDKPKIRNSYCGTGKIISLYKDIKKLNLPLLKRKWNKINTKQKSERNRW